MKHIIKAIWMHISNKIRFIKIFLVTLAMASPLTLSAVSNPDLIVKLPTVSSATLYTQEYFTIDTVVANQGLDDSTSTTLRYYLSSDSTIYTDDTQLGTDAIVNALAPKETSAGSITTKTPSSAGTYYVGACVVAVPGETDTTNNCSVGIEIVVSIKPIPDLTADVTHIDSITKLPGQSIKPITLVTNQGTVASSSTTLRYYISSDATITGDDTQLGTDSVPVLDIDGQFSKSTNIPAPLTPGTYYIGACVDVVTDEVSIFNNCSSGVEFTVNPAPDLIVETPLVNDITLLTSQEFGITVTVRNQGTADVSLSDTPSVKYYLSSDATISIYDTQLGTDAIVPLSVDGITNVNETVIAPTTPGTYYVGVCVDIVTGESPTNNNCSEGVEIIVSAAPDLIAVAYDITDTTISTNQIFFARAFVRNQGSAISPSTNLIYYISNDPIMSPQDDTPVATRPIPTLAINESHYAPKYVTAPTTPGTYYIGSCVEEVAGESPTTNNCSVGMEIIVAARSDLIISGTNVSTSLLTGERFVASATVKNQGLVVSESTTLRYYFSTDNLINLADTELGTLPITILDVNSTSTRALLVTAPTTPGTYYFGACVDATTEEGSETNNCSSPGLEVTVNAAPDLIIQPAAVNHSALLTGETFTAYATVRNQGTANSTESIVRYYLSTDSTISVADTEIGTETVIALPMDSSTQRSISVTAPTTPGIYYIGACVDAIGEGDITNNCSTGVQVTVSVAPDLIISSIYVNDVTLFTGQSFSATGRVLNSGTASSTNTTLRYYISTDSTISTEDTEFGTEQVSALAVDALEDITTSGVAPITPGTYWVGTCADAIMESDTNNNCSTGVQVTVSAAADLIIQSATVNHLALLTGETFIAYASVRNQGTADSTETTVRYYLSTNSIISSADNELGTSTVQALPIDSFTQKSISPTAPTTPGTYYYGACVDVIVESNIVNNCSSGVEVTVTDVDSDGDGMLDGYEIDNGLDPNDASDANDDDDSDGDTNLEEHNAGTDPQDASSNTLSLAIEGNTKYMLDVEGNVKDIIFSGGTYTNTGTNGNESGTYDIVGYTLTLDRLTPNTSTLAFTYLGENANIMSFNLTIDGDAESQAYFYNTVQERDSAIPALSNGVNPALIMYLLN